MPQYRGKDNPKAQRTPSRMARRLRLVRIDEVPDARRVGGRHSRRVRRFAWVPR